MIPFKTMVILDLETTGLPHLEHRLTKITEMSLVACLISHCQGGDIPRVINKLTLAFNPMKMILPATSKITGLDNELLEELNTFDDSVVSMLNEFLGRLPQPLCIIAHNGNKFDFPILMKQLLKCTTKLIDNLYCADSLLAFRAILPKLTVLQSTETGDLKSESILEKSTSSTGFDESESEKRRLSIETTPKQNTVPFNAHPLKPSVEYDKTKHSSVSRKLNFDNEIIITAGQNNCDNRTISKNKEENDGDDCKIIYESQMNQKILKSHKLCDIYSYLHDGDCPNFHRSEDDCMALLSCINKCKDDFLLWLYKNSMLLSDVEPLF